MQVAPTPRETVLRDGIASLYRFKTPPRASKDGLQPLLLVPSMINRWYILDLKEGGSVVEAMKKAGFDVWCMDWGVAQDEDRFFTWEEALDRLGRMVRRVLRVTGAQKVGLLGYSMGATMAGIYTALHPDKVQALVNLAGPFDFSKGGILSTMTDPAWFHVDALSQVGNISGLQMFGGFTAVRPTGAMARWVTFLDRCADPEFRETFKAIETWNGNPTPFPASVYRTYIEELYQKNLLIQGEHHVRGKRVDLGQIQCPVLSVVTERDTVCPPEAASALNEACGSSDQEVVVVPGGHVDGVVGSRASHVTYPAITGWLSTRLRLKKDPAPVDLVASEVASAPEGESKREVSVGAKATKSTGRRKATTKKPGAKSNKTSSATRKRTTRASSKKASEAKPASEEKPES